MEPKTRLSQHFTLAELIRSNKAKQLGIDNTPPPDLIPKLQYLCENILEPVRNHFGKPFSPNSGYRSGELNKAIGGSATSQHCKAQAVDIEVPGIDNCSLAFWIRDNLEFDQLILENYKRDEPNAGWVHVSLVKGANRAIVLTYRDGQYLEGIIE